MKNREAEGESHMKISILGLGLIGGSIARALRQSDNDFRICAVSGHMESIDAALKDGVIDEGGDSLPEFIRGSDIIILTAPVDVNLGYLKVIKPYLTERTVLTDAGSVKQPIMRAAADLGLSECFIGGHPMAGSEKKGYANSSSELLKGARYIITPGESSSPEAVERLKELVVLTGAIPVIMTPEEHDRSTALVSHVPHLLSAALVNLVRDNETPDGMLGKLAAGGFRDLTRISSSDPALWEQICMENRGEISELLEAYASSVMEIRDFLETGDPDSLRDMFSRAREYREGI